MHSTRFGVTAVPCGVCISSRSSMLPVPYPPPGGKRTRHGDFPVGQGKAVIPAALSRLTYLGTLDALSPPCVLVDAEEAGTETDRPYVQAVITVEITPNPSSLCVLMMTRDDDVRVRPRWGGSRRVELGGWAWFVTFFFLCHLAIF